MKTRREFLLGSVAVAASAAMPVHALAEQIEWIGWDMAEAPSWVSAYRVFWDAEQEMVRITGIDALDFYQLDA